MLCKRFSRAFTILSRRSQYSFYDLVQSTPKNPQETTDASHLTARDKKKLEKSSGRLYMGNYELEDVSPEEKIMKVFGGRIKGEDRVSSSRVARGEPKNIAGILVPEKPQEPDNCCMSGCINCVWQLFDDDVNDWNEKRKKAAAKLREQGGRWPENFHAPVKLLGEENLPLSVAHESPKDRNDENEEEGWDNIPVSIRVFAQTEKNIQLRRNKKNRVRATT